MTKLSLFAPLLGAPGLRPADWIFRPKKQTKKILEDIGFSYMYV